MNGFPVIGTFEPRMKSRKKLTRKKKKMAESYESEFELIPRPYSPDPVPRDFFSSPNLLKERRENVVNKCFASKKPVIFLTEWNGLEKHFKSPTYVNREYCGTVVGDTCAAAVP